MELPEIKRNLDIYIDTTRSIVKRAIDEAYATLHINPTYAENAIIEAQESLDVILDELEKFRNEI